MKQKPPIFQVRLSPDMAVKVEALREQFEARISKTAFVELLLFRGIGVTERINNPTDNSESSFEKKGTK